VFNLSIIKFTKNLIVLTLIVYISACSKTDTSGETDAAPSGSPELQEQTQPKSRWTLRNEHDKVTDDSSVMAEATLPDESEEENKRVEVKAIVECKNKKDLFLKFMTFENNSHVNGSLQFENDGVELSHDVYVKNDNLKKPIVGHHVKYQNDLTIQIFKEDALHKRMEHASIAERVILLTEWDLINDELNFHYPLYLKFQTEKGNPIVTIDFRDDNIKAVLSDCKDIVSKYQLMSDNTAEQEKYSEQKVDQVPFQTKDYTVEGTDNQSQNQDVVVNDTKTFKPSFSCSKAKSVSEKLICSDSELSTLDNELFELYKKAKEKNNTLEFKEETTRAWKYRENNCFDKQCLVTWFNVRKMVYSKMINQ